MKRRPPNRAGFSLFEVLTSLVIIAILVGLLIPCLILARDSARQTICAGNLKQISNGFLMYTSEWDRFPGYPELPEWKYGGVVFRTPDNAPVLASDRPINRYVADEDSTSEGVAELFHCPSDAGVFQYPRGRRPQRPPSVLEHGTCFETFGSSYRANRLLLDARLAGIDPDEARPLRLSEVSVSSSRLIVLGDPEWYYATRQPGDPDAVLDSSWHNIPGGGNIMAMDGSVRFIELSPDTVGRNGQYTLHPRR
jgi:prepilin-type N-terminal cleavage/methylation domain-containing protein